MRQDTGAGEEANMYLDDVTTMYVPLLCMWTQINLKKVPRDGPREDSWQQ